MWMKMFRTSAGCRGNWKVGRHGWHSEGDSKNSIWEYRCSYLAMYKVESVRNLSPSHIPNLYEGKIWLYKFFFFLRFLPEEVLRSFVGRYCNVIWVDNSILDDQEQGHLHLNISLNFFYKLQEYTFFKLKISVFMQVHKCLNFTLS